MTALSRVEAALSALPRDATDEQVRQVLAEFVQPEWLPIETAPRDGQFVAWRERQPEPLLVYRHQPGHRRVVHAPSGLTFHTRWWRPHVLPPVQP